ncbi:hypothetical protein LLE49_23840 [Alicyclobacillus tolerans]|uniref:flagellin N-terminal helical domain-containing protein n=1 Tax=Alicyclobacillus tolerans TaxID=90970 RepID=UPI001F2901EB|nr:flagellin [Alicyclobacillus tolerans]MCF8567757.1 hypothetical protein [Alicyclobacillus tolerans]
MSSGFWINFNPAANNVLSNLSNVNSQVQQESQVMSTGQAVNSAADNPAAYAISQNMQMESNGLNVAVQNAQQGVSMLQTATGAQQQVIGILQTMSQLATQASQSGTQTVSDRAGLQLEMNSLAQEVNSITNQTQYNGLNILSGQFSNATGGQTVTLQVGANQGQTISFNIGSTDVNSLGVAGTLGTAAGTYTDAASTATTGGVTSATAASIASSGNISLVSNNILESGTYEIAFTGNYNSSGSMTSGTLQLEIQGSNGSWSQVGNSVSVSSTTNQAITVGDAATGAAVSITFSGSNFSAVTASGAGTYFQADTFQISGNGTSSGSEGNGWQASSNVVGLNILTQSDASSAITKIHDAISNLTAQSEGLGAVQNRLSATISDLQNTSSNLQTANSVIVGANMASEQTKFAQSQILEQAGISVLSQVQQQPGLILKLLS